MDKHYKHKLSMIKILPVLAFATSSFAEGLSTVSGLYNLANKISSVVNPTDEKNNLAGAISSICGTLSSPEAFKNKISGALLEKRLTPKSTAIAVSIILISFYLVRMLIKQSQGENAKYTQEFAGINITASVYNSETPILGKIIGASIPLFTLFGCSAVLYAIKGPIKRKVIEHIENKLDLNKKLDPTLSYVENVQIVEKAGKIDNPLYRVLVYGAAEQCDGCNYSVLCYKFTAVIALAATLWTAIGYTMNISVAIPSLPTFNISGPSILQRPMIFLYTLHWGCCFLHAVYRLYKYSQRDATTEQEETDIAKLLQNVILLPIPLSLFIEFVKFCKKKPKIDKAEESDKAKTNVN